MRRGLAPEDLGDLLDQPISAVASLVRPDGTVLSRPVWHRWQAGHFVFQCPNGDRKIALLEGNPSITLLLAEDAFPYRAIEVRGQARMSRDDYWRRGLEICRPYVETYDPDSAVESYLSAEPGVIVEVEATITTCWDYADDAMMPPTVP